MRVIGGTYKSRKLKEVKSTKTRPTTDKNREALFNMMGQFFNGGKMLDLFAGSGAIGIEALSRGITNVNFVDSQYLAINTIRENIKSLNIRKNVNIIKKDVFSYLLKEVEKYDIIFADPPYALNKYREILSLISSRQLITQDGIIVLESDKSTEFIDQLNNLYKYKEKKLGNTKFVFYKLEEI